MIEITKKKKVARNNQSFYTCTKERSNMEFIVNTKLNKKKKEEKKAIT